MTRLRFCLLALALAGCNPNDFGGTLDHAPVQLIERPDGFGSNAGRVLLPLAPPSDNPKVAGRLLFAGTDNASLAVADFDQDGEPSVKVVDDDDLIGLGLGAGITSMASLSSGIVAMGVPNHSIVTDASPLGRVVFARMANNEGELSFVPAAAAWDGKGNVGGHLGLAVARGQITQASNEEVIAVADLGVSVLSAGGPELASTTCAGALAFAPPPDLYRALAVADLLKGGQQEIALGLPKVGGVGRVLILQYGINPAGASPVPELFCTLEYRAPDTGVQATSGFGTSLTAAPDLDGDGLAELLVGAPPDRAYLFYSAGVLPPKVFNKGDTLSEFGQRVALMDIDRDGVPEVGISALLANAGSTPRAGEVFFYKLNGDGVTSTAVLFDRNAEANKELFGIGLADMEFNGSRACGKGTTAHVPVVGADKGIFTFYRFVGGAADPRCFAQ